jgi:hypothetical protein
MTLNKPRAVSALTGDEPTPGLLAIQLQSLNQDQASIRRSELKIRAMVQISTVDTYGYPRIDDSTM